MVYLTLFLALTSMLSGTLTYAASTALPNEPLYFYKIGLNEKIEHFVAHTPEAQTQLDFLLLKERLGEARELAHKGTLTPFVQNDITQNIQMHVLNITNAIVVLQNKGSFTEAATLANALSQELTSQTQTAASLSALGSTQMQVSLAPIVTKLRTTSSTIELVSSKAQILALANTPKYSPQATITTPEENIQIPPLSKEEIHYFK